MRTTTWIIVVGLAGLTAVVASTAGGCSSSAFQYTTDFELGEGLKAFDVEAGVPSENVGTGTFGDPGVTIGSGSVEIPASAVAFAPPDAAGGKGTLNLQATYELEVTVWIAPADEVDTVCGGGEQYGPFTATLDENYTVVSISPSQVTLTQNTLSLLNGGEFSLCIRVLSPVDGTVTVEALRFRLGL